jgi:hypothetical protein
LYDDLHFKGCQRHGMRWVGNLAWLGEMINVYKSLVEKLKERLFRRSRKIILKFIIERLYEDADWIHVAQDWEYLLAFVNTELNLSVSYILLGISSVAECLLGSMEELSLMESDFSSSSSSG